MNTAQVIDYIYDTTDLVNNDGETISTHKMNKFINERLDKNWSADAILSDFMIKRDFGYFD